MHLKSAPCFLLLLGAALVARAQDPFNEEEKPKSPFGSEGKRATPLWLTFETYTLPPENLDGLLLEGAKSGTLYDRVRELVSAKKATLDNVMAVATVNNQRATIDSVDEVNYATEWDPPMWGRNFALPTAWNMRPTGHRIEVDPMLSADKRRVVLNVAPDFTRLTGFSLLKSDDKGVGELAPDFAARKFTTSASCPLNVPTLLGTSSRPIQTGVAAADGDGKVAVTFGTVRVAQPAGATPPEKSKATPGPRRLGMVFRFYSMPRATARDLLATTVDGDKLHSLVRALPPTEFKLERLITTTSRSGQRTTVEETAEYLFGTELEPGQALYGRNQKLAPPDFPEEGKTAPAGKQAPPGPPSTPTNYNAFEMRPVGWRIEVDTYLWDDGRFLDIQMAPEHTELRGQVKGHPLLVRYPDQPVFGTQKLNASTVAPVGHQCFIGTMNVPHDTGANGRTDDGRVWLAFVMVTVE